MTVPHTAIDEALALLPPNFDTPEARAMMIAIGLQESRFIHRRQVRGPARGFWQFELGGGVAGVLNHPASRDLAAKVCASRGVDVEQRAVYDQLAHDDVLAAAFARLLLWTDRRRLPELGSTNNAWDYYLYSWRPGRPHPKSWPDLYAQALLELQRGKQCSQP